MNEYKENENIAYTSLRPIQITTRRKTAKVYLYPFSLSNPKLGLFKLSKSPVENESSSEMVQKKTDQKKTCRRVLTSKMKALSSEAESRLLKPSLDSHTESSELEHKSTSDPVTPSVDMESSDEDSAPGPVRVSCSNYLLILKLEVLKAKVVKDLQQNPVLPSNINLKMFCVSTCWRVSQRWGVCMYVP